MADLIVTRAIASRARIKGEHLGVPEETDVPLGNWYVTFLPMAERNAFVYMSSRTQMSFLMLEGERLTPEKLFISLVRGISLTLELAGFHERVRERVINGYRSVAFARASNLSMLGVLTNCALDYEAFIEQDGGLKNCNLDQLMIDMNCRPARKLGFNTPLQETAIALDAQPNNSFKLRVGLTQALGAMKIYLALIVAFLAAPALADTPLPPPEKLTICSPAGQVCAISDPATNVTVVSSQTSRQKPWTIPGWHRWLFVSDDGQSVVVGYSGMNLVPVDVTLKEPVLFFYNKGKLVRTVTLGDLYTRKSQLRRTVSHFAWAHIPGINRANQLVVELVNGKKVAFAASTGQVQPLISDGT